MSRSILPALKASFIVFAMAYVNPGEVFAETGAPSSPPGSAKTVVAPSVEVVVESAMCEMRAAQDGSLEEYVNRERALKLEQELRERGLLGNALGDAVVDQASRMSGCELPAIGETICETLENHRNSRIDPECRNILAFEEDRINPVKFRVPEGQSLYSWALVAFITLQTEVVYPSLKDKEVTRAVDPRLTNMSKIISNFVKSDFAKEIFKQGIIQAALEGLTEGGKQIVSARADAEWSRRAEEVVEANSIDAVSIRLSRESINGLEEIKSERAAQLLTELDATYELERSGTLNPEEARKIRNWLIQTEEADRNEINKQIAVQEASIEKSAKDVQDRSDPLLEERRQDLKDACEQLDCPEYTIDIGARKAFEEDVAFCKAKYGLDPTIEAMPVSGLPPDDTQRNTALGPKCNIETFERIISGFSERTQTLTDAFGAMGSQKDEEARAFEEQRDAEDGYEDALAAHKSACRHGEDSCNCVKAKERLGRATERLYPIERLPSDIAREYLGRNAESGMPLEGSGGTVSQRRDLVEFDLCKPGARLIAIEGENGVAAFKFVEPGDPDYPKTSPNFLCNPLFAPFLSRFERTSIALGAAPPPPYSQEQIEAMIAQARPIGGDLIEAQRRQWERDDSCEDEGRPFPNGRGLLPVTPLPSLQ